MRLIVGKLGDSDEVPGNNPFHALALSVEKEFNRLKGMAGREHSSTLVGRATPFGQLNDSVPFSPGDTAKDQAKRPQKPQKETKKKAEQEQPKPPAVSFSAGFSSPKDRKKPPRAAAAVLNATAPVDLKAPGKVEVREENLSRKQLENLRLAVRPTPRPGRPDLVMPHRSSSQAPRRARPRPPRARGALFLGRRPATQPPPHLLKRRRSMRRSPKRRSSASGCSTERSGSASSAPGPSLSHHLPQKSAPSSCRNRQRLESSGESTSDL